MVVLRLRRSVGGRRLLDRWGRRLASVAAAAAVKRSYAGRLGPCFHLRCRYRRFRRSPHPGGVPPPGGCDPAFAGGGLVSVGTGVGGSVGGWLDELEAWVNFTVCWGIA